MTLMLFLPGAKALTPELTAQHSIDDLFSARSFRETFNGPGGPGLLVSSRDCSPERLVYSSEQQRWSPRFGVTSLVGTWLDHQPTPEELARPKQLPGKELTLLDGQVWLVPQLRAWHMGSSLPITEIRLPRVMQQCTTTGRMVRGRVVPSYQQIWERSCEVANTILGRGSLDDSLLNGFALDLLAVNYRVDQSVASHLEIVSEELAGEIIMSALDMKTFEGLIKNLVSRSESSGTPTESGATQPTED